MKRGFIQIPVLLALVISTFIGAGAYVKHKLTKTLQDPSYSESISIENSATTTSNGSDNPNISEDGGTTEDSKDSLIYSLKKQVVDLAQKINYPVVEKNKTSIITLPSGAVVEVDSNGNNIRTLKEAPSTITQNNSQSEESNPAPNQSAPQSQEEIITRPIPVKITLSDSHELPGLFCSQTEFTVHVWDKNNIEILGENVEVVNIYKGVTKNGPSPLKVNFGLNDMKEVDLLFKIKSGTLEKEQAFVVYEPNFRLITTDGRVIDPNHESGTFTADSDGTYADQRGGLKLIKLDSGFVCKH